MLLQLSQTGNAVMVLLVIIATYVVAYRVFRIDNPLSMLLASLTGGLASGFDLSNVIYHLVEGSFTFLNIVLIIYTATVFIYVQRKSKGLDAMVRDAIVHFHRYPRVLVVLLMFLIMLPPAFTGPGADGIFAFGAMVASVLSYMGMPLVKITAFVALGGTLGVFAPPVNVPAMIISSGINMPYLGFIGPLLLVTIPISVACALIMSSKYISGPVDAAEMLKTLPAIPPKMKGIRVYLPLMTVIGLMFSSRAFPHLLPHLGVPLIFVIGTVVAILLGRVNVFQVFREAFADTLTINAVLIIVGSLVQIMSLTGVRGLFVLSAITVPVLLLYLIIFAGFPLFAGVLTSFGAASVFGIPYMLALLGKDPIITTVGLSLVATVGNLVPPTAVLGRVAAIATEYRESYNLVARVSAVPLVLLLVVGILMIVFANQLTFLRFLGF